MHLVTLTVYSSNGCATSEDIFWKLDALQNFVRDLHWPDPEFANHLNQRLKAMAADMIESSIHRSVFIISQYLELFGSVRSSRSHNVHLSVRFKVELSGLS